MSDKNQRMLISLVLAVMGLLINQIFGQDPRVFYGKAHGSMADCWRFMWMGPFVCVGLSFRAFRWRNFQGLANNQQGERAPWVVYFEYLVWGAAASFLFFTAAHTFLKIDDWLFYPSSAIIAFAFGLIPGRAFQLRIS